MPIGVPLPTAELQLFPTTSTSWSTASHSQMQVGITGLPKREDIRYWRWAVVCSPCTFGWVLFVS